MNLEIINQSSRAVPRSFLNWWGVELTRWLRRKKVANLNQKDLCLVFLPLEPARKLNKKFRQKNYATDVLSFAGFDETSLGELVFCSEVLHRQAKEHKLSYRLELGYMVIHGVLHLLGYDHEGTAKEAEKMYALQDEAFDFLSRKWHSRG